LTGPAPEQLGRMFLLLERRMRELQAGFGLSEEDLGLDMGIDVEDLG
jgi:hypothetical protein